MAVVTESLPLTETLVPEDQAALAAAISDAHASGTAMYPIGGGTSLDYGLTVTTPGLGISLASLKRIIDYPARDMTITVEAGLTLAELASTLAAERQWLPLDLPERDTATLGGAIATAFSGPRRYGYGTLRDYVIGISAVDGRGMPFKGGGRVVKNVAGYDFCKLLTGSMGTLGVISQVTLKIKPAPLASALVVCDLHDVASAEKLLAAIVDSAATPTAVELLSGPHWQDHASLGMLTAGTHGRLVVGLEGTANEVTWMVNQLTDEWTALGATHVHAVYDEAAQTLWHDLTEFPALPDAALVLKATVLPSRVAGYTALLTEVDPEVSIQAHAGNGIVLARFASFDAGNVSRVLVGRLQPAASLAGGRAVILSSTLAGLTRQAVWGAADADVAWMEKVKQQFDPKGLLNPGRFVYSAT